MPNKSGTSATLVTWRGIKVAVQFVQEFVMLVIMFQGQLLPRPSFVTVCSSIGHCSSFSNATTQHPLQQPTFSDNFFSGGAGESGQACKAVAKKRPEDSQ